MSTKGEKFAEAMRGTYSAINLKDVLQSSVCPRPNEYAFASVYDGGEIKADLAQIKVKEAEEEKDLRRLAQNERVFEQNARLTSEAVEIILAWGGEKYGWFGEGTTTIRTSKFDAVVNRANLVIEFQHFNEEAEPQRFALSLHIATATNNEKLDEMLKQNLDKVTSKKLAEVKYFNSPTTGEKGRIENVIPVSIALEGLNAVELINSYSKLIHKTDESTKSATETMGAHPAQKIFLLEIVLQLKVYLTKMDNSKKRDAEIISEIENILELLQTALDSMTNIDIEEISKDAAYNRISKMTGSWMKN